MEHIWKNGMMGVVLGDALGMPIQFLPREELKKNPVKTMENILRPVRHLIWGIPAWERLMNILEPGTA